MSEEELTEKEKDMLWEITKQGIDIEKLVKAINKLYETFKPVFDLYDKNMNYYLKYKKH